jgi:hypothetical protein
MNTLPLTLLEFAATLQRAEGNGPRAKVQDCGLRLAKREMDARSMVSSDTRFKQLLANIVYMKIQL